MNEEEIRERVYDILLKQGLGEELTPREERILAYAYHAAGEQRMVRPRAELEE